ncbi:MAG: hypothetical protein COT67_00050 [Candidatus Tagabacteria bacterium CG09_land_8_20_14_0_10_41_14]|uniref:Uncharacterized protein n=2 Tax=Candidatus Tagaibacteriota TaxID=1817918 RepID=A0A2H0WM74_9BACT|nr:MAG: hypothetical protein COT67_00050 [Candidatus Tagabacteria bacterium CG09_land_8_20_14_0_10_41_14]PJE72973.1 MAG: hypothetical protein COV00_02130 [Candidatus Tagabacteria bacterium CG10_big_fil_rev_8_21_14_0_10_40_13]
MAVLTWRSRKKITYFLGVVFALALIVFLFIVLGSEEPTCFDGIKNQDEEGVDCGGVCASCVVNPKDIVTLWTRVLPTDKKGVYEAASLVENPNLFYGLPAFKYTFRLYDIKNILVAVREGRTYLNPRERFVLFTANINTGERIPARAFMEIELISDWRYIDKEKVPLVVSSKRFENIPFPSLGATLLNESLFALKDINVAAVLYDENENAMAVSSTYLSSIPAESTAGITFTWPAPFSKIPTSSQIFTRVNLTE